MFYDSEDTGFSGDIGAFVTGLGRGALNSILGIPDLLVRLPVYGASQLLEHTGLTNRHIWENPWEVSQTPVEQANPIYGGIGSGIGMIGGMFIGAGELKAAGTALRGTEALLQGAVRNSGKLISYPLATIGHAARNAAIPIDFLSKTINSYDGLLGAKNLSNLSALKQLGQFRRGKELVGSLKHAARAGAAFGFLQPGNIEDRIFNSLNMGVIGAAQGLAGPLPGMSAIPRYLRAAVAGAVPQPLSVYDVLTGQSSLSDFLNEEAIGVGVGLGFGAITPGKPKAKQSRYNPVMQEPNQSVKFTKFMDDFFKKRDQSLNLTEKSAIEIINDSIESSPDPDSIVKQVQDSVRIQPDQPVEQPDSPMSFITEQSGIVNPLLQDLSLIHESDVIQSDLSGPVVRPPFDQSNLPLENPVGEVHPITEDVVEIKHDQIRILKSNVPDWQILVNTLYENSEFEGYARAIAGAGRSHDFSYSFNSASKFLKGIEVEASRAKSKELADKIIADGKQKAIAYLIGVSEGTRSETDAPGSTDRPSKTVIPEGFEVIETEKKPVIPSSVDLLAKFTENPSESISNLRKRLGVDSGRINPSVQHSIRSRLGIIRGMKGPEARKLAAELEALSIESSKLPAMEKLESPSEFARKVEIKNLLKSNPEVADFIYRNMDESSRAAMDILRDRNSALETEIEAGIFSQSEKLSKILGIKHEEALRRAAASYKSDIESASRRYDRLKKLYDDAIDKSSRLGKEHNDLLKRTSAAEMRLSREKEKVLRIKKVKDLLTKLEEINESVSKKRYEKKSKSLSDKMDEALAALQNVIDTNYADPNEKALAIESARKNISYLSDKLNTSTRGSRAIMKELADLTRSPRAEALIHESEFAKLVEESDRMLSLIESHNRDSQLKIAAEQASLSLRSLAQQSKLDPIHPMPPVLLDHLSNSEQMVYYGQQLDAFTSPGGMLANHESAFNFLNIPGRVAREKMEIERLTKLKKEESAKAKKLGVHFDPNSTRYKFESVDSNPYLRRVTAARDNISKAKSNLLLAHKRLAEIDGINNIYEIDTGYSATGESPGITIRNTESGKIEVFANPYQAAAFLDGARSLRLNIFADFDPPGMKTDLPFPKAPSRPNILIEPDGHLTEVLPDGKLAMSLYGGGPILGVARRLDRKYASLYGKELGLYKALTHLIQGDNATNADLSHWFQDRVMKIFSDHKITGEPDLLMKLHRFMRERSDNFDALYSEFKKDVTRSDDDIVFELDSNEPDITTNLIDSHFPDSSPQEKANIYDFAKSLDKWHSDYSEFRGMKKANIPLRYGYYTRMDRGNSGIRTLAAGKRGIKVNELNIAYDTPDQLHERILEESREGVMDENALHALQKLGFDISDSPIDKVLYGYVKNTSAFYNQSNNISDLQILLEKSSARLNKESSEQFAERVIDRAMLQPSKKDSVIREFHNKAALKIATEINKLVNQDLGLQGYLKPRVSQETKSALSKWARHLGWRATNSDINLLLDSWSQVFRSQAFDFNLGAVIRDGISSVGMFLGARIPRQYITVLMKDMIKNRGTGWKEMEKEAIREGIISDADMSQMAEVRRELGFERGKISQLAEFSRRKGGMLYEKSNNWWRVMSAHVSGKLFDDQIKKYISGKINYSQFITNMGLDALPGGTDIGWLKELKSTIHRADGNNLSDARRKIRIAYADGINFHYGRINQPLWTEGMWGRAFGKFGLWPMEAMNSLTSIGWGPRILHDRAKAVGLDKEWGFDNNRTSKTCMLRWAKYYGMMGATLGLGAYLGIDASEWVPYVHSVTWSGGPAFSAIANLRDLATSDPVTQKRIIQNPKNYIINEVIRRSIPIPGGNIGRRILSQYADSSFIQPLRLYRRADTNIRRAMISAGINPFSQQISTYRPISDWLIGATYYRPMFDSLSRASGGIIPPGTAQASRDWDYDLAGLW